MVSGRRLGVKISGPGACFWDSDVESSFGSLGFKVWGGLGFGFGASRVSRSKA